MVIVDFVAFFMSQLCVLAACFPDQLFRFTSFKRTAVYLSLLEHSLMEGIQ